MPIWKGAAAPLTAPAISDAAAELGADADVIRAVWQVEAGGRPFRSDGSLTRRFEPHHVPREQWSALGFSVPTGSAPWRASLALSRSARERMFAISANVDLEATCRATSWGGPQIMGFNAEASGYASASEMVTAFAASEAEQLKGFVGFVKSKGLDAALRAKDWRRFAQGYNGTGQADVYAARLQTAYAAETGVRAPVVLRVGSQGRDVRALQRALSIPEDGAFGPGTEAAVRSFQEDRSLPVDGVVGAVTWAELERDGPALASAQPDGVDVNLERAAAAAEIAVKTGALWGPVLGYFRDSLPSWAPAALVGAGLVILALWMGPKLVSRYRQALR